MQCSYLRFSSYWRPYFSECDVVLLTLPLRTAIRCCSYCWCLCWIWMKIPTPQLPTRFLLRHLRKLTRNRNLSPRHCLHRRCFRRRPHRRSQPKSCCSPHCLHHQRRRRFGSGNCPASRIHCNRPNWTWKVSQAPCYLVSSQMLPKIWVRKVLGFHVRGQRLFLKLTRIR